MMTDQEIAEYLGIAKALDRELLLKRLSAKDRKAIEQMRDTEVMLDLYRKGKTPLPRGVIICSRNRRRHRRRYG